MSPLATLDELESRLDWTLDDGEKRIGVTALEDLSEDARYYGSESWTVGRAPAIVKRTVLKAAVRYMRNPDGYTTSRAGDETLGWNDAAGTNAGTAFFDRGEVELLRECAGRTSVIVSVQTRAWDTRLPSDVGYVPIQGSPNEKPFPFFTGPVGGW